MINATTIGKYFFLKNPELTDIQIQKLVYYAYSWYMVQNAGNKLFEERPQAWIHGPVFRSLFDSMKKSEFYNKKADSDVNEKISMFLDIIYKVYGKYSGNELEQLTHREDPWINARNGLDPWIPSTEALKDEDIMKYFAEN